eukprot:2489364-Amphidinium_carterae.1
MRENTSMVIAAEEGIDFQRTKPVAKLLLCVVIMTTSCLLHGVIDLHMCAHFKPLWLINYIVQDLHIGVVFVEFVSWKRGLNHIKAPSVILFRSSGSGPHLLQPLTVTPLGIEDVAW